MLATLVGDVRRAGALRATDGGRPAVGAGNEQVLRTGSLERRHCHGVRSTVASDCVAPRGRPARMRNLDRHHRDSRPRGDHVQPPGTPVALDAVPAPRLPLLEQDDTASPQGCSHRPAASRRTGAAARGVRHRRADAPRRTGNHTGTARARPRSERRSAGRSAPTRRSRRPCRLSRVWAGSCTGRAPGAGARVSSLSQSTTDGTLAPWRDDAGLTAEAAPATTTSTTNAEPARENTRRRSARLAVAPASTARSGRTPIRSSSRRLSSIGQRRIQPLHVRRTSRSGRPPSPRPRAAFSGSAHLLPLRCSPQRQPCASASFASSLRARAALTDDAGAASGTSARFRGW